MTTLFALCISSFIPGAGFYLSRHLSSFPHIFLHSLIPTFHPLTITFAVQRSFSIPEQDSLVPPANLITTRQGHIRNVSTLSQYLSTPVLTFSHSPMTLKISSLENDQSLSEDLFPNSPEENVRIATSSIFSSTDGNTWFYIYFMYIKRMFPSIGRQYTRVAARTQTYPRYPPTCPQHPPTL